MNDTRRKVNNNPIATFFDSTEMEARSLLFVIFFIWTGRFGWFFTNNLNSQLFLCTIIQMFLFVLKMGIVCQHTIAYSINFAKAIYKTLV